MGQMKTNWLITVLGELGAALALFSFFLLTILHQPVAAGPFEAYRLADGTLPVVCGPQSDTESTGDVVPWCDACRISFGATLPQAPCGIAEQFVIDTKAPDLPDMVLPMHDVVFGARFARGPPIKV